MTPLVCTLVDLHANQVRTVPDVLGTPPPQSPLAHFQGMEGEIERERERGREREREREKKKKNIEHYVAACGV